MADSMVQVLQKNNYWLDAHFRAIASILEEAGAGDEITTLTLDFGSGLTKIHWAKYAEPKVGPIG